MCRGRDGGAHPRIPCTFQPLKKAIAAGLYAGRDEASQRLQLDCFYEYLTCTCRVSRLGHRARRLLFRQP